MQEHTTTIRNEVMRPHLLRATCTCGWSSRALKSTDQIRHDANKHVAVRHRANTFTRVVTEVTR